MESNYRGFDHISSAGRMRAILGQSDLNYSEVDSLPSRDKLTYSNGYYAYCSALFIDIRGSSKLPEKHKRPTLAKIYRSYISEVVAVINGYSQCSEINIIGDGAWAVFDTPTMPDIDSVFEVMFVLNSMIKILNKELQRVGIDPLTVGIGASYGRALMVKAGYNGSGISDVVYMGDVVNAAAKLAAKARSSWNEKTLMVSDVFHQNLNDHNRALLERNWNHGCYHGDVVSTSMEEWMEKTYP
jgi:class 3 adenylate cyclase